MANGDLIAAFNRLLDEKLAPIIRDTADIKRAVESLRGSLQRINVRLAVVEATLDIDPFKPKH
jgi:hypothetical protein